MSDEQYYGDRSRSSTRKKADKILNIAIGLVIILIVVVGGQLFFGGSSSNPVVIEPSEEQLNENNAETIEEGEIAEETVEEAQLDNNEETVEVDEPTVRNVEEPATTDEDTNSNRDRESSINNETPQRESSSPITSSNGHWKPIGTVQQEPFTAVYDKDHINWEEMKKAFQYATGLGEDMTMWHVRNGGNHQSAVGTVSNRENRNKPYEVRIEWVTNEGWLPVSVIQLEENRFLELYLPSAQNND